MIFDIMGFVDRNFLEQHYYGSPPTDIRVNCPYCHERGAGEDTKFHLYISVDKQVAHCFRCGYKASWVGLVMDVLDVPYWRAVGELYVKPKISTKSMKQDVRERVEAAMNPAEPSTDWDVSLPKDYHVLTSRHKDHLTQSARSYLKRRGLDSTYWRKYKLGVANSQGYRVIIPIEKGYWQGRAMHKWLEPKYLNPEVPASDVLFNAGALLNYDQVVICEGAFSAMAIGDNAVALIGKEPTKDKVRRLLGSGVRDYIITVEPGAFANMSLLASLLHGGGCKVTLWVYEDGDPMDGVVSDTIEYGIKAQVFMKVLGLTC